MTILQIIAQGTADKYAADMAAVRAVAGADYRLLELPARDGADKYKYASDKDIAMLAYLAEHGDTLFVDADCRITPELLTWVTGKRLVCGWTHNVPDAYLVYSNRPAFWQGLQADYIKFDYASHGPVYGFLSKMMRRFAIEKIPNEYYIHRGIIINSTLLSGGQDGQHETDCGGEKNGRRAEDQTDRSADLQPSNRSPRGRATQRRNNEKAGEGRAVPPRNRERRIPRRSRGD